MKIFYVIRSIAHLPYHETIIKSLCEKKHKVKLLIDKDWSGNRSDRYVKKLMGMHPNLHLIWSPRRTDHWRNFIFGAREIRSYRSYLKRKNGSEFYLIRWQNYLPKRYKKLLTSHFIKMMLQLLPLEPLFKCIEWFIPADPALVALYKRKLPDLVVASPINMRFSEEVEYVKTAKVLNIPTVGIVLSWDNLTTKGLFNVKPDLLLAWNESHYKEAKKIHGFSSKNIVVTGSSFFDKWFDYKVNTDDHFNEFSNRIGFVGGSEYILYLGSSANIAKDESWVVKKINESLEKSPDARIRSLKLLVRPHPSNTKKLANLEKDGICVWPRPPFDYESSVPESDKDLMDFFCSIKQAVAVIGINTSAMIDAVICDAPTLSLITPEYDKTQLEAEHFKVLLENDVVYKVNGVENALSKICEILNGIDIKKKKRGIFIENFIRPYNRNYSAGETAATAIELFEKKYNSDQITEELRKRSKKVS